MARRRSRSTSCSRSSSTPPTSGCASPTRASTSSRASASASTPDGCGVPRRQRATTSRPPRALGMETVHFGRRPARDARRARRDPRAPRRAPRSLKLVAAHRSSRSTSSVTPAAPPGSQVRSVPISTTSSSMRWQRRRDRDLAHRLGERAVAHHEALGADREVAAHRVRPRVQAAHRLDVERLRHRREDLVGPTRPGLEDERTGADAGRRLEAAAHRRAGRRRLPTRRPVYDVVQDTRAARRRRSARPDGSAHLRRRGWRRRTRRRSWGRRRACTPGAATSSPVAADEHRPALEHRLAAERGADDRRGTSGSRAGRGRPGAGGSRAASRRAAASARIAASAAACATSRSANVAADGEPVAGLRLGALARERARRAAEHVVRRRRGLDAERVRDRRLDARCRRTPAKLDPADRAGRRPASRASSVERERDLVVGLDRSSRLVRQRSSRPRSTPATSPRSREPVPLVGLRRTTALSRASRDRVVDDVRVERARPREALPAVGDDPHADPVDAPRPTSDSTSPSNTFTSVSRDRSDVRLDLLAGRGAAPATRARERRAGRRRLSSPAVPPTVSSRDPQRRLTRRHRARPGRPCRRCRPTCRSRCRPRRRAAASRDRCR